LISGGTIPIAVTLSTEDIFEQFLGEKKQDCLLHGHSYTGYPIGCWVSATALKEYKKLPTYDPSTNSFPDFWDQEVGILISSP